MDIKKIESLLEKYLDAETTLQEERTLADYFSNNNIEPQLKAYQPLFSYFNETKKETYTKPIRIEPKRRNWKWLSVAASIMLLVTVYTGYNNYQRNQARLTYEKTQMAFNLLSTTLNKGTNAIGQLETFEDAKNKIFK